MKLEGDSDTNFNWYSYQAINKGSGGFGNKKMNGDYPKEALLKSARILRKVLET